MADNNYVTIARLSDEQWRVNNNGQGATLRVLLSDLRYGRDQSDKAPSGRIITGRISDLYDWCFLTRKGR